MPIQIKPFTVDKESTAETLGAQLATIFQDLEDQLNNESGIYFTTGKVPASLKDGDTLVTRTGNIVVITVKNTKGFDPLKIPYLDTQLSTLTATVATKLAANGTNFKGLITNTSSGITNFPNHSDWGFQNNAGTLTFNFNSSGTVKKVTLT